MRASNRKRKPYVRKAPVPSFKANCSPGYREQIQIGRAIEVQLPEVMSAREVAEKMGVSRQYVERVSALALYKIRNRFIQLRAELCQTGS